MTDVTKLLDGSVEDVKAGLTGKNHDDLLKLRTAEQDGKKRQGALDAIEAAIAASEAERSGGRVASPLTRSSVAADFDGSGPAGIEPATSVDTSGAPQQIVPDVDLGHPAVDADPRAGTSETQNRIDFNDPTIKGHEAVEKSLAQQGK